MELLRDGEQFAGEPIGGGEGHGRDERVEQGALFFALRPDGAKAEDQERGETDQRDGGNDDEDSGDANARYAVLQSPEHQRYGDDVDQFLRTPDACVDDRGARERGGEVCGDDRFNIKLMTASESANQRDQQDAEEVLQDSAHGW